MIQHYNQLRAQVNSLNEEISASGQIQKIYSTSRFVCLSARFPGKTRYYYLGRGAGYEGLWEGNGIPPSEFRAVDKYLEYLRKHLRGSRIGSFQVSSDDRVLIIEYEKLGKTNLFFIFWSGRLMYFSNYFWDSKKQDYQLFLSWKGPQKEIAFQDLTNLEIAQQVERFFEEVGYKKIHLKHSDAAIASITSIEQLLENESKSGSISKTVKRKSKSQKRKVSKIEKDLLKVMGWSTILSQLENNMLDLCSTNKMVIVGWKFSFPKMWNEFKRKGAIYDKVKRLKKAETLLQERLKRARSVLEKSNETVLSGNEETVLRKTITPVWIKKTKHSRKEFLDDTAKMIKVYKVSLEGLSFQLGVGLNTQGNDFLRNKWASKEDYWFHLEDGKSAHIVVKLGDISLQQNVLEVVAAAMGEHSKVHSDIVPLIYTRVKNVKGVKGSSGKVTYKKPKYQNVYRKDEWMKLID